MEENKMVEEYFKPGIKYRVLVFPYCAFPNSTKIGDCNHCNRSGKCTSKLKESVDSKLSIE